MLKSVFEVVVAALATRSFHPPNSVQIKSLCNQSMLMCFSACLEFKTALTSLLDL